MLSKDVKGKGSWRNLRFQSVSARAEFQSVEELAEERNFQSVKEWWCGDKGGRVAGPLPVVRDIRG